MKESANLAPPGLKGLVVAKTGIGSVRGAEGFFHYRQYDATEVAARRSFEAAAHLLLNGELPSAGEEADFQAELARGRAVPDSVVELAGRLADAGHDPMSSLRALLCVALDGTPSLDQAPAERRASVMRAIGMAPVVLALVHRRRLALEPLAPDPTCSHAADYLRMLTGEMPAPAHARAVETYLSLTADHGFNASTFTGRVVTSTGADIGSALASALAALSGPLHGGAPGRVLDMLNAIGDPGNAQAWATAELEAGRNLMGFGHAVYRAEDPRGRLLRDMAVELGGELIERAVEIETRLLDLLRRWKPEATIVTNVEFYAAVVLHLAGVPQSMFTPTFAVSRIVGWSAHVLEQAANNKIMRPSACYAGPAPPVAVPRID